MQIPCIWEHNGNDTLLYAIEPVGAYTRGESLAVAAAKMPDEIAAYCRWSGEAVPAEIEVVLAGEKVSELTIRDADSDVLFAREALPLTQEEYEVQKALALRSAADFLALYRSIPDKHVAARMPRRSFYGAVPRTAEEMYEHTKNVNAYYFSEIEVEADNDGDILDCRRRGFQALEAVPDFLQSPVLEGSYGEDWSVRKLLRRFIWHDRIHAKAMYRMATACFDAEAIDNPFCF